MRRVFLDTEFTDLPWTGRSELLWVGLACSDGRSFGGLCADTDVSLSSTFVRAHVLPRVTADVVRMSRRDLARAVVEFADPVDELWAWCPDEAGVSTSAYRPRTRRRSGTVTATGTSSCCAPWSTHGRVGWTAACRDLADLARRSGIELPPNPRAHDPVADAEWGRSVFARAVSMAASGAAARAARVPPAAPRADARVARSTYVGHAAQVPGADDSEG